MKPRLRRLIGSLLMMAFLSNTAAFGCGPFALEAIFVHTTHPGYPLEKFAEGQIGVVQPTYARSYLFVAYRYLSGSHFGESEQKALSEFWKERLEYNWNPGEDEWTKAWSSARETVPNLAAAPKIDVYRSREKPNEYETFLNCQKDSFDTAISTLKSRVSKYGADSPVIRDWVQAQDEVFANCSEGKHIPANLAETSDALATADRTYQIAAANFYAGNFDEAKTTFETISRDNSSPWKSSAPYLIARTLIRKASLGPNDTKEATLAQAETRLNNILSDKHQSELHPAAQRLMELVRLRLHPAERMRELAALLVSTKQNEQLKQDLWDYTVLLDQYLETDDTTKRKSADQVTQADDLSDWIFNFQEAGDETRVHSLARWQATHSQAWLVAALSKSDGKNNLNTDLIQAGQKVSPTSRAFASARYHVIRLLHEAGKTGEARRLVDETLKTNEAQLDQSTINLFRGQRMMMATTLSEFLKDSARLPAALSWNDDGREVPAETSPEENKGLVGKSFFDQDAANVLNKQLPLPVLQEAALSKELPPNLRQDVTQATWLRAVLLGDLKTADSLTSTFKAQVPAIGKLLDDFSKETQPEAKKFAAIFAWLKTPGMEPVVDQGIGRESPIVERDTYRDNWWCSATFNSGPTPDEDKTLSKPFTSEGLTTPQFVSKEMLVTGTKQFGTLSAIGSAPGYLCQEVILWANKSPADPRIPEALHLAVMATRYGCTDTNSGRWSKAAFDLLHRKYENTPWAKKTPYWFKD